MVGAVFSIDPVTRRMGRTSVFELMEAEEGTWVVPGMPTLAVTQPTWFVMVPTWVPRQVVELPVLEHPGDQLLVVYRTAEELDAFCLGFGAGSFSERGRGYQLRRAFSRN